jgi:hypothetical protein
VKYTENKVFRFFLPLLETCCGIVLNYIIIPYTVETQIDPAKTYSPTLAIIMSPEAWLWSLYQFSFLYIGVTPD